MLADPPLIIVAGAGAYAVSLSTPKRYRSTETLIYLPAGTATAVTTDQATRELQTAVGLVQAAPVLAPASKRLHVSQEALRTDVSAALPADSNLITINATAATPPVPATARSSWPRCSRVPAGSAAARDRCADHGGQEADQKLAPAATADASATVRSLREELSLAQADRAVATGDFAIGDPARLPTVAFQPKPPGTPSSAQSRAS